jgi:hypothetical protein
VSEPNEPTKTENETEASAAPNAETQTEASAEHDEGAEEAPAQPLPELSIDAIRELLKRCRENPHDENSLVMLNELREYLLEPTLAKDVVSAAHAVTRPVLREANPSPVLQVHMMILLSFLIELSRERDGVDALFVEWLRHPQSYGPGRGTPPSFQKAEFVQRVADLLGWGSIDIEKDRGALERFLDWVDSWTVKNRFKVRRTLDVMRRNFGAPELWRRVHYPKG